MRARKVCVELSSAERRLVRDALLALRTRALAAGIPTEDIDAMLVRVMKRINSKRRRETGGVVLCGYHTKKNHLKTTVYVSFN